MSVTNRLRKSHGRLSRRKENSNRLQLIPATRKGRADEMAAVEQSFEPVDVCLMTNVQSIAVLPKWAQWIVRFIYFRYGWAAMAKDEKGMLYSVEYRGVTPDESEARFLSSETGCSYMKLPWRSCLPVDTGQYGTHDFPLSEVSHKYRKRELPFVQMPRRQIEMLEAKIEQVVRAASA